MTQQHKSRVIALLITVLLHSIFILCIYLFKIGCMDYVDYEKKSFVEVSGILNSSEMVASSSKASASKKEDKPVEKTVVETPVKQKDVPKKTDDVKKTSNSKVLSKNSEHVADSISMRKKVDDKIISAFSKKAGSGSSGSASSSEGSSGMGNSDGLSNIGNGGAGYSLSGRSIVGGGGVPVRPNTNKPVFGKIVIGILVNSGGDVIDAWVDINGTQISDSDIRRASIAAAKATKFNSINSSNNQRGKIVYNFKVK